ncbi:hypothetical protein DVR12_19400 [Chitinophaga silvatica]|uniref:Uncharacterized protein n=1 Tax=Chitinophaga silvatica TaxID=2282649 RepID=A0A3E1Y705_9BACT|nr:hypothetical protein [Chitinophaga silvatica]RFS20725.1 hypothetical protein DVR12_19400 [Chitinophaga silvatica]
MKKAKFILSSSATIAIIGGAIAYKSPSDPTVYKKITSTASICGAYAGMYVTGVGSLTTCAIETPGPCQKISISRME